MFTFKDEITVDRKVKVRVPVAGNAFREEEFTASFRIISIERQRELVGQDGGMFGQSLLREVFVGWPEGQVRGEDGAELAFSEALRDKLIDIPYLRIALLDAFNKASGSGE